MSTFFEENRLARAPLLLISWPEERLIKMFLMNISRVFLFFLKRKNKKKKVKWDKYCTRLIFFKAWGGCRWRGKWEVICWEDFKGPYEESWMRLICCFYCGWNVQICLMGGESWRMFPLSLQTPTPCLRLSLSEKHKHITCAALLPAEVSSSFAVV